MANAGNLTVSARDIEMSGNSVLLSAETLGKGNGGNLTVEASESLTLQDGAVMSTTTVGNGNAGNLTFSVRDIEIIGKSPDSKYLSRLTAEAKNESTGAAGTITINTETLSLGDQAEIRVKAASEAPNAAAGDLLINSNNIRLENEQHWV